MQRRWQIWTHPDGRLVWLAASDPLLHPPPPPPLAGTLGPPTSDDALLEGPTSAAAGEQRNQSLADLLIEARRKLLEGDGVAGSTEDAGKAGLFCTGLGRAVAVSEGAVKKARAVVGGEVEDVDAITRKQPFGDGADVEVRLRETDVLGEQRLCDGGGMDTGLQGMSAATRGQAYEDSLFKTGSGKAVSLSKGSIKRARAICEGNVEVVDGGEQLTMFQTGSGQAVLVSEGSVKKVGSVLNEVAFSEGGNTGDDQPMFETGLGMISTRKGLIQKAKTVLEERGIVKGGSDGDAVGSKQFPMFQTRSGRSISMSEDSILKARAILESGDISKRGNFGNADVPRQQMLHTGLGRSVTVSTSSIEMARAVLVGESAATRGNMGDVQFQWFQTSLGRSISVSEGSIQKARAVLEENAKSGENVEDFNKPDKFPMFQTGLEKPALFSEGSIERAKAMLKEGNTRNSRHGVVGCQLQTGLGRPVAVSQSSIQKARAVLEEGNIKMSVLGDSNNHATMSHPVLRKSASMSNSSILMSRAALQDGNAAMNEKAYEDEDQLSLFQTGLGRSVLVSKGSIEKANTVLEARNISTELEDEAPLDNDPVFPMFETGSRSVLVCENSSKKAQAVLDAKDTAKSVNNNNGEHFAEVPKSQTGLGKFACRNKSASHKPSNLLEQGNLRKRGHEDGGGQIHMFRTASGMSVLVNESSVQTAKAVLKEDDNINKDKLQNNVDKKCATFVSPLKTSSAQTVNISSAGISQAANLLGLEENILSTQLFGHVGDKLGTKITVEKENPDHRLGLASQTYPMDVLPVHRIPGDSSRNYYPTENQVLLDSHRTFEFSKNPASNSGQCPMRLSTAGGRSMVISSDALQHARGLLGELDLAVQPNDLGGLSVISACKEEKLTNAYEENTAGLLQISSARSKPESAEFFHQAIPEGHHILSLGYAASHAPMLDQMIYDESHTGRKYHPTSENPKVPKPSSITDSAVDTTKRTQKHSLPAGALVDITNCMDTSFVNMDNCAKERRRIGGRCSISPFKRPRSSRFTAPLNTKKLSSAGISRLPPTQNGFCRTKLSAHYPFQHQRKSCKEYFGGPPCCKNSMEHVSDEVKHMDAEKAEKYKFQNTGIGAEGFRKMLLACGASLSYATKEWVSNHYKWIVWKLASFERCYPTKAAGKYLTVPNVFEELKYRYDREVNYGHRSAIRKILEGNASPALMMVLCISAICSYPHPNNCKVEDGMTNINEDDNNATSSLAAKNDLAEKIELTDGWYSLEVSLDAALSKELGKRKLFVGQKLRIWGASLCGWVGPVPFDEASSSVRLMIHINGTYRASWDEPLGFCKQVGLPLAFKCIKASGGRVPRTLVGVTRIYPILYRERFADHGFVVRSERMERKALQLYQQRVSKIAEDILSEQQEHCETTDDSEEGAKFCKMLERAAEPEVIMAGMTSEQLMSFSSYQAKQRVFRQSEMVKKVEKALEDAGLNSRDVTPFLRVRVVGLTSKCSGRKSNKEGLITIWNPTEKQKVDLVEGQIYCVTGLTPLSCCAEILHLQTRGSSTMWRPLALTQTTNFEPFFTPREAILLSNLGKVPLASEFDIAGIILHVGDVHLYHNQKKQWLFLTDGSRFITGQKCEEQHDCLLAVSFSSPTTGDDDSAFLNYALSGSIVGFSNLVKRPKDQMKHIWVAEATENSTYTLSHDIPKKSHLKEAATSVEKWASESYSKLQLLKEMVLYIIGDSGG